MGLYDILERTLPALQAIFMDALSALELSRSGANVHATVTVQDELADGGRYPRHASGLSRMLRRSFGRSDY
jgi:hypothetical protein